MPNEQAFIKAARQAGYSDSDIKSFIGSKRKGVSKWAFGDAIGPVGKGLAVAGNLLNAPSYAIGGALKGASQPKTFGQGFRSAAVAPLTGGLTSSMITGGIRGLRDKTPVQTELPRAVGLNPQSAPGMALGFAGELLTPDPTMFVGDAFKALRGGKQVMRAARPSGIAQDLGKTLLEKSYRLNESDINKIAEAIGANNEATKLDDVINYLEGLKLRGSSKSSVEKLNKIIEPKQQAFNSMVRTDTPISRQPYIDSLLEEAIKAEGIDTPQSRALAKKIFDEALLQEKKIGKPLTNTKLTDMTSRLFSETSEAALSDPASANLSKRLAISGQTARETISPGSTQLGRDLRGLRTAQDIIGKASRKSTGSQLFNAFKGNAAGAGVGAGIGYVTGQDPLVTGTIGFAGGLGANNPWLQNKAGKALTSPGLAKGVNMAGSGLLRGAATAGRVSLQPRSTSQQTGQAQAQSGQIPAGRSGAQQFPTEKQFQKDSKSYTPIISPRSPITNKSPFGRVKKVKKGSFV